GRKGSDQAVDQRGIDLRHVAEAHDRAVRFWRYSRNAGAHRAAEPLREIRIMHKPNRQAFERGLHPLALMPGYDDHRLAALRAPARPPISARSLFGPPMRVERPAASTTAATLCPLATGSSRGCGRVTISINRPPTPMPAMASRGTSRPANSRISTQSKPFS